MTPKHEITRDDIMPVEEYAKIRRDHRRALSERKRDRRLAIGPDATIYFENYDTMWSQIQEMLYIERGGDEQLEDELRAYNPLVPKGNELVATLMIEIDDPDRRDRVLSRLGGIERTVFITVEGETIEAVPEEDVERTDESGRASSVHFLHFPFTPAQIEAFRRPGARITVGIGHPEYGHIAVMPEAVRAALAEDFD